jgi:thiamine-phosphate pyrophosphorylase
VDRLHCIVDADAARRSGSSPERVALAFLDGGARFLQIRAKRLPSAAFLSLCDAVVEAAASFGAEVIVNDRVDLARMTGAAGVHVGQDDLPPAEARRLLGPSAIVGFSTHTLEQIGAALLQPISYVAVGPVFGTATKDTGYQAVGLALVRAARARVPAAIPIVAIGGITLERAASVLEAGASHVAVIGDLLATGDPARRVAAFRRLLQPLA